MGDETEFKIRFEVLVVFGAGNAQRTFEFYCQLKDFEYG